MTDTSAPSIRESIASSIASATSAADAGAPSSVATPDASPASAPVDNAPAAPATTLLGKEIPAGSDSTTPVKGRGPDGKFAPKNTDPAIPPASDVKPTPDPTKTAQDIGSAPPILAPATWGKDAKVEWSSLPRSTQAEIERREKDRDRALHKERSSINTERQRYQSLESVLAPRRHALAAQGLSEDRAIAQLFALSDSANGNPAGFIQWFAQQRGVDLASLVAGSPAAAPVDPNIKALQEQIARQNRAMQEMGQHIRGGTQQRETEAQNAMLSTVEKWASETDESGNPKRPYFERLENQVLALLPLVQQEMPSASPTERLDAAYDRAVYAHPETRTAVQQQSEAQKRQEEQRKQAQAAEAARRAGASITGSSAPNAGSVPPKSVGEGLRRALEAQKGRAA